MPTKNDLDALDLYRALMEEAKARMLSINALTQDQRGIPSPLVREFGFLQLRMTCEIIALGCLVAHGDIGVSAKVQDLYEPGRIFKEIERLHPSFYPIPVNPQPIARGWNLDVYTGGDFLTRDELPILWAKCGGVLHKGSLKKLIGQKSPLQNNFKDVMDGGQKILNLLSAHRIASPSGQKHFLTFLDVAKLGGIVQVALAEGPAPT